MAGGSANDRDHISIIPEISLLGAGCPHSSTLIEMRDGAVAEQSEAEQAIISLGALAHESRLALFRLLVQAGGNGMPAGAIAEALALPNSSLSFHLAQLTRAGLIQQTRKSRSLIYTANYSAMNCLVGYLIENCCGGTDCAPDGLCEPANCATDS